MKKGVNFLFGDPECFGLVFGFYRDRPFCPQQKGHFTEQRSGFGDLGNFIVSLDDIQLSGH